MIIYNTWNDFQSQKYIICPTPKSLLINCCKCNWKIFIWNTSKENFAWKNFIAKKVFHWKFFMKINLLIFFAFHRSFSWLLSSHCSASPTAPLRKSSSKAMRTLSSMKSEKETVLNLEKSIFTAKRVSKSRISNLKLAIIKCCDVITDVIDSIRLCGEYIINKIVGNQPKLARV